jgi:serine/threonine protein kinase
LLNVGLEPHPIRCNLLIESMSNPSHPQLVSGEITTDWSLKISESLLAGRYQVFKVLGRGGFGITYLARNIYLPGQPLYVIKHLAPKFTSPTLLTIAKWRFHVEARTLSKLGSHSQVPLLIDYFRKDREMYLVQEYIPGETLWNLVRQGDCLNEEKVGEFLAGMLKLLNYIHSHRIVHRDIKPQNIIRCLTDERLVLIDFGAVSDREGLNPTDNRIVARAIGTPGYAPPEQIAEKPTGASDIYALGMTCLFLLTGQEPLSFAVHPHTGEIIWRTAATVSDGFADMINQMIKTSLSDRYASAGQVLNALHSCQLRNKLRQYMENKYATHYPATPDATFTHLPPAVQWAMKMSAAE